MSKTVPSRLCNWVTRVLAQVDLHDFNCGFKAYRREVVERSGDARAADNVTDQDLLREVMNTVGKPGRLGESIRCVVSVAMLTEGWDANTVTHVLGVRAFGTQLLCEQVIGRALRRQSYELNAEGLFDVEYADVLGIPFDFTAKPVIAKPQPPRETVQHARQLGDADHPGAGQIGDVRLAAFRACRATAPSCRRSGSPPSSTPTPCSNSRPTWWAPPKRATPASSARPWT